MSRIAVALLVSVFPLAAVAAPETYTVDPLHTFPHFAVSHLGFSTMHGRFDRASGKITLDRAAKTGAVDIAIDAASIDTGFSKDPGGKRSRDEHLRSPDFFNVVEFPKITFKSVKVNFKGGEVASVEGNLTMVGVTKPVTLTVTRFKCGADPFGKKERCGADAVGQIKRSDFGIKYALPAVGDDLKLTFEIEAIRD